MDQRVISQEIIDLYDEFTHKPLPRRVFMTRLSKMVGGTAAAVSVASLLDGNYAQAAMVPADDSRLDIKRITYPGATGDVKAYQVMPKGADKLPAVIVIHENRGLQPHIEDVARRVALEGFLAIAVDFMSPIGGTPDSEDAAREAFSKVNAADAVKNGVAAVEFADGHANSTGKVGAVGFCWGGGMVNQMAVNAPNLEAGVVYYGIQPKAEEASKVKAKLLIHYAGEDARINKGAEDWNQALKSAGVDVTEYTYEGVQHAFNNDTSSARYNEAAAKQAWDRTIEFFKKNLA